MNPRVVEVTSLDGYRLRILFNNGERRILDVSPYITYPAFKRLANIAYFSVLDTHYGREWNRIHERDHPQSYPASWSI